MFIVDHVRPKHRKLQYFKSASSVTVDKQYQISPVKRFKTKSLEDKILMPLISIRLHIPVEDLAFRFGISPSYTSNTIITFIIFLGLELKPLIYWPKADEWLVYRHPYFSGIFHKVEDFGDCHGQWIQYLKCSYSIPDIQHI